MQKNTRLRTAGTLLVVSSSLALAAALFMAFFTWGEYFVPSHLGSVRVITEAFYVVISIIIVELFAFVLGLCSAVNSFRGIKFGLSILGATFLLIAGLLFFTNIPFGLLPHVESLFGAYSSNGGLLLIYQLFCGIPILILASASIFIFVSSRKEFKNQKINPLLTLKAVLILCLVISVFSALFSLVPYLQAINQSNELASSYPLYTILINTSIFALTSISLTFLIRRKYFLIPITLTVISLLAALSIPFLFISIFPWIGSFVKGFVTESSTIILLAVALIIAILGRRTVYFETPKNH